MEDEIEEKLNEIYYEEIKITVKYLDIRKYLIEIKFLNKIYEFEYLYDVKLTFDYNIKIICEKIEYFLIKIVRR